MPNLGFSNPSVRPEDVSKIISRGCKFSVYIAIYAAALIFEMSKFITQVEHYFCTGILHTLCTLFHI